MARKKATHSAIQSDEALYKIYKQDLDTFSANHLASFGLVSDETIRRFLKGKPVGQITENKIIQTLNMAQAKRREDHLKIQEEARASLAA